MLVTCGSLSVAHRDSLFSNPRAYGKVRNQESGIRNRESGIRIMSTPQVLRFGNFELDVRSRELRCGGACVRLQEQPLEILQLMLERPGEVITRDELRQRLWPEGTFVDFEHSLNAAIKRLRAALGDDADKPTFIETVPRRGYRFVGSVPGDRVVTAAPALAPHVRLVVLPFS